MAYFETQKSKKSKCNDPWPIRHLWNGGDSLWCQDRISKSIEKEERTLVLPTPCWQKQWWIIRSILRLVCLVPNLALITPSFGLIPMFHFCYIHYMFRVIWHGFLMFDVKSWTLCDYSLPSCYILYLTYVPGIDELLCLSDQMFILLCWGDAYL